MKSLPRSASAGWVRCTPSVDAGRWQVSNNGGTRPAWARDGQELFYFDASNHLTSVRVRTGDSTFSAGTPTRILNTAYATPLAGRSYDVSPDGRRFLMLKEATPASDTDSQQAPGIAVVVNWLDELKARVRTR